MLHRAPALAVVSFAFLAAAVACSSSSNSSTTPETDAGSASSSGSVEDAGGATDTGAPEADLLPGCTKDPGAPAPQFDPAATTDPIGGADKFTLEMALAGFPAGSGKLTAAIQTEQGVIKCTLDEAAAPISVANFIGLARGTRPYNLTGKKWQVGKFYDGLTWHRVIPDFVIQGGDPDGDGTGGPGYDLVNENHIAEPLGTLAMAAAKVPSGSQFYIVVGQGPAANYNVFGTCETENAIKIANVPRDADDKPNTAVHLERVRIGRCP